MKNAVFWDVTACGSCKNRSFGGTSVLARARCSIPEDDILHSHRHENQKSYSVTHILFHQQGCITVIISDEVCHTFTRMLLEILGSQESTASTVTGYGLGGGGVISSMLSRPVLEPTQPPIQWVLGPLFPGRKQPRPEVYHSPPTCARVNEMWAYTVTQHMLSFH
jgi:hypothetical protein